LNTPSAKSKSQEESAGPHTTKWGLGKPPATEQARALHSRRRQRQVAQVERHTWHGLIDTGIAQRELNKRNKGIAEHCNSDARHGVWRESSG